MKRLLLFDMDNTIYDYDYAHKRALEACYKFLRKKYPLLTKKTFFDIYYKARREVHLELSGTASMHNRFLYFQRMFEILGLPLNPELLDELTELYWDVFLKNMKLFPGVKSTLDKLKENNVKIGIVTDFAAHIQIKKLKKLGITEDVDFIVTSEEAGKEKPHPSIFLLALKKASMLPKDAVFVGDSLEKDVMGAKHLGITAVLLTRKRKVKKNAQVDYIIKNFNEILRFFKVQKRSKDKFLVVDLLGTLFKEKNVIQKHLIPLLKRNKIDIPEEKLVSTYLKYSLGQITAKDFNKLVPKKIEMEFLDKLKIDKETLNVLRKLKKRGYILAILSNLPKRWGYYLVKKYNLDKLFSYIIFSGDYGSRKPDEKLYLVFLEKSKANPENCYLIDDKLINLKEARFLLMKTIWFKREKQDILFIPDYVIKRGKELEKILK